jgi:hypothetical protein
MNHDNDVAHHPPAGAARPEGHRTCSCGQELDICTHAHCPRCGHRIAPQALARVA